MSSPPRLPTVPIVFVVEHASEDGFTAHALGHPIFTEADDLDELESNIEEAVACHFGEDAQFDPSFQ